jgi:hypothetical protein
MKIRPVIAELFHVDTQKTEGQTDGHDKANSRFLQFCELAEEHQKFYSGNFMFV